MKLYKHLLTGLLLWLSCYLQAQDPFFVHFNNSRSYYNPALVGEKGASSINTKYKTQWNTNTATSFKTMMLSYEEHLPCSILDYGFMAIADEEGEGRFRTVDVGGKVAGTLAWGTNNIHNIRLGISAQVMQQSINYDRLVFSDQIDAKWGTSKGLGTAFIAPEENQSNWAFIPAGGIVYKAIFNRRKPNRAVVTPTTLALGASWNNIENGDKASILNLTTNAAERYSLFLEFEYIFSHNNNNFFAIKPLVLHQAQGNPFDDVSDVLSYWEYGAQFIFNRRTALGIYGHSSTNETFGTPIPQNTSWVSANLDLGSFIRVNNKVKQRFDLGLSFSKNVSGLANAVGLIYEVSVSWHFTRSFACDIGDLESSFLRKNDVVCPETKNKKLYENIWYKSKK